MLVRLAFAVMIQVDADILLIDEVLAVGDAAFQQKCYEEFAADQALRPHDPVRQTAQQRDSSGRKSLENQYRERNRKQKEQGQPQPRGKHNKEEEEEEEEKHR